MVANLSGILTEGLIPTIKDCHLSCLVARFLRCDDKRPRFSFGDGFERELGEELMRQLKALPGTHDVFDYMHRGMSLARWQRALQKGVLPNNDTITWPAEPFRSKFAETLRNLEMLNFTRRYPKLLDSLLTQMIDLVHKFEAEMLEMENNSPSKSPPKQPLQPSQQQSPAVEQNGQSGNDNSQQDGPSDPSKVQSTEPSKEGETQDIEVEMSTATATANGNGTQTEEEIEAMQAEIERIAEGIVHEFEEEMSPVMDSLNKANDMFQNLDDLLDENKGFDLQSGLWKRSGWHEVEILRTKLENMKELRDLVRQLGRSGGKGPKRKAPAQMYKAGYPPGVIRSALQPEETCGLCRSGDLSRMLPSEAALMAMGWPKYRDIETQQQRSFSKAARMLHRVRRAERNLLSYERSGWLEDEPSKVLPHKEYRPAAEQGPIIVCLDTSGSMQGVRETVAKAVVLECLRGARRQERSCYLYAFSSYGDIRELELSLDVRTLPKLLDFLEHSFNGGTDVTGALELTLDRVQSKEWSLADILIVTDGEMAVPDEVLLSQIEQAQQDLGLEVHGLLVGNQDSRAMEAICSHLHIFQSWSAAGRKG